MNHSHLSVQVENLLIEELITQGGFDAKIVTDIVTSTNLEKLFFGEFVNELSRRIKIVEKFDN